MDLGEKGIHRRRREKNRKIQPQTFTDARNKGLSSISSELISESLVLVT